MTATLPSAQPATFERPRVSVGAVLRHLRLASGLVLFAYVLTHLVNHALGNVSLAAMEWALGWVLALWSGVAGTILLYGAFVIHIGLGLWALTSRRSLRFQPREAIQYAFGLAIPLLLLRHVVANRLSYQLNGTSKGYAQQLYGYFVDAPGLGLLQGATLLIVWSHGVLGLFFWLRLKPWFARRAPVLLCVAVLIPILALLGTVQGGRETMRAAADPAWRAANLGPDKVGTPVENAELARIRDLLINAYLGLIGLALLGRGIRSVAERRRGLVAISYPSGQTVRVRAGVSVLEASRLNRIPHASVCGGRGRCSTCRVRVIGSPRDLPDPSATERAVLDRVRAGRGVRLACQLRPVSDIVVAPLLASAITMDQVRHLDEAAFGEERFVVALFVDMRSSTRLAETRLPYDTVFLINRFLEAVGRAVTESGGSPNQFLGDGMLALFGLRAGPEAAARQGLDAIRRIGASVDALNASLAGHVEEPIRFGIGLHAGTAILGEIGDREGGRTVFTAIGDPVNVAARLQGMTKRLGIEALVSDDVFETAGLASDLPGEQVAVEGRAAHVRVRRVERAAL